MLGSARRFGWLVIGTLLTAAAYEVALALGAGSLGPEPGEGIAGSAAVEVVALLAMFAAAALGLFHTVHPWRGAALFAPTAVAFLVAFFFTYDPYFAPHLRRYSDGGAVPGHWIAIVAAVAVAVGVLTGLRPRVGAAMTSAVVFIVIVTTVLAGDGH
jgi:uncharacterized membrane protein YbaN (DUF454 family)